MIYKFLKEMIERLFGKKWICEHCGAVEYAFQRPFCKPCCHIEKTNKKMLRIK